MEIETWTKIKFGDILFLGRNSEPEKIKVKRHMERDGTYYYYSRLLFKVSYILELLVKWYYKSSDRIR